MKANKIILLLATILIASSAYSQGCQGWGKGKDSIANIQSHVLYRDYVKAKNYEEAFPLWQKVYKAAPSGSEKHFIDGVKIYKDMIEKETDDAKKAEYTDIVYDLFDQRIECFGKKGAILGRKAYNMFYMGADEKEVYATFKESVDTEGNKTKDFLMVPFASNAVDNYRNKNIEKADARGVYDKLMSIIDYNIENNEKYAAKFEKAKVGVTEQFEVIERNIFDCDYFREDIVKKYEADKNNPEVYREVYKELIRVGCPESDAVVAEIRAKDKSRVDAINAENRAKQQAAAASAIVNAPKANKAKEAYDSGNYKEAIRLYSEAASEADDAERKGKYYYAAAQTCAYKTKKYSEARKYARLAMPHMPSSGKPYMLIGNIYASGASRCGSKTDDWGSRLAYLAAIAKWSKAKSVDPSMASEADGKIAKYASYKPTREQAFARGLKDGQSANVGCWIGESVTIRTVKGY